MDKTQKTQQKILRAARTEFLDQGFSGARTQAIADRAGVNKALLHYHFGNKEQLFRKVLERELIRLQDAFAILNSEGLPYPKKLPQFSSAIRRIATREPGCIPFLLQAIRQQPQHLPQPLEDLFSLDQFRAQIRAGMDHGFIAGNSPDTLIVHLLALALIVPVAGELIAALTGQKGPPQFLDQLPKQINAWLAH
ncbi:MAG: TetR/AcrR family transcriptional regulator [Bacteroidota bacterium]